MEQNLLEKLAKTSDEERKILCGSSLNISEYTSGKSQPFNVARLTRGKSDVSLRIHTRFTPFPKHKHDFVELMTVISGNITHFINGKEIKLREGDILLMNKHISHSIKRAEETDIGINIIMSDAFFDTIIPELSDTVFSEFVIDNADANGAGSYLHFHTSGQKRIENLIENILFELTDPNPYHTAITKTVALLFGYLSRASESLLEESSTKPSKADRRKMEISAYISDNYRLATLGELATKSYLSVPYLSKIIVEYFGKSFKELVLEERMKRASELLVGTDIPISQIISNVGYENSSYFHRQFKKIYKKTPLDLRKSEKKIKLT